MECLGLPRVSFPFLLPLLRQDGVSQDDLADEIRVDKATVARHLMILEEAGLVTRIVDEHDRRVKRVSVTDKVREAEPEIKAVLKAWSDKLMEGFTPEEKSAVLGFLRRMAENARQHWEEIDEAPKSNLQQQNATRGVDF